MFHHVIPRYLLSDSKLILCQTIYHFQAAEQTLSILQNALGQLNVITKVLISKPNTR